MTSISKLIVALTVTGMLGFAIPASAQEETDKEDEEFVAAVKDFGYAGGVAWKCAAEGDPRTDIERQAMVSYNGLVRLFGTDDAFLFAAAFGAGTSSTVEKSECEAFAKAFREGLDNASVE